MTSTFSVTCLYELEIPHFLSDEECEHIISLARDSGLTTSIAGFDVAAYEGNLDEDMAEAGKRYVILRPLSQFDASFFSAVFFS